PSGGDRDAAGTFETLLHVLPVPGGDQKMNNYAARAGLPIGVVSHRSFVSLTRSPVAKAPTKRPAPPPFSSIMVRHRRWLAPKLGESILQQWREILAGAPIGRDTRGGTMSQGGDESPPRRDSRLDRRAHGRHCAVARRSRAAAAGERGASRREPGIAGRQREVAGRERRAPGREC